MDPYEKKKREACKEIMEDALRETFYPSKPIERDPSSKPWLTQTPPIDKRLLRYHAVLGTEPEYEDMGELKLFGAGYFVGGFKDKWYWEPNALERLSTEELEQLFCWLHRNKRRKTVFTLQTPRDES